MGLRTWESAGAGASSLKAHSGGVKCPGQVAPTTGLKLWFPQTQGGGHPSVYNDRNIVIMVPRARQRGANCHLCPVVIWKRALRDVKILNPECHACITGLRGDQPLKPFWFDGALLPNNTS